MLTDFSVAKLEFYIQRQERKGKLKSFLIHLLKTVTMSSRKLGHSLKLDDLAL